MSATAADLIAEESSVSSTDLTNVYNALNAMLFPFATGPATITITSVIDGGTGNAPKVAWSCTQNGTRGNQRRGAEHNRPDRTHHGGRRHQCDLG